MSFFFWNPNFNFVRAIFDSSVAFILEKKKKKSSQILFDDNID